MELGSEFQKAFHGMGSKLVQQPWFSGLSAMKPSSLMFLLHRKVERPSLKAKLTDNWYVDDMIATEVTAKTVKSIATMNSFGAMSFMLVMSLKTEDYLSKGIYIKSKAVYVSSLSNLK